MVKVAISGNISVYVYAEIGQPHHLPHCHVRWPDGSTQVVLPTLRPIAGDLLPPAARQLLREHLDRIVEEWNRLNPERAVE